MISTCDLCDAHPDSVRVLDPLFQAYGARPAFSGRVRTVRCHEDNSRVRELVGTPGEGCVLVVDGGGSLRRSLVGGNLAAMAAQNGWAGIVVNGAVRDLDELNACAIGIRALALCPMATVKRGQGEVDVPVAVGGQSVTPGDHLYADADGMVVALGPLA